MVRLCGVGGRLVTGSRDQISPEIRERCDIVQLSPGDVPDYIPIKLRFFHLLTGKERVPFSIYYLVGWELVEFMKPKEFTPEGLKNLIQLVRGGSGKVILSRKHYSFYEKLILGKLQPRLNGITLKDADIPQAFRSTYLEMISVSNLAIRGALDQEAAFRISHVASKYIGAELDLKLVLTILLTMVNEDPVLYDHTVYTAMIAGLMALCHPTLPRTRSESKSVTQAGLLHDIDRGCTEGHKSVHGRLQLPGLRELGKLIEGGAPLHRLSYKVIEDCHERFCGGGLLGKKGRMEADELKGIHPLARYLTPACYISKAMRKSSEKEITTVEELLEALKSKVGHYFDPDIFLPLLTSVNQPKEVNN